MKKQKPNLKIFTQLAFWKANPGKTLLAYLLFSIGCLGGISCVSFEMYDNYKKDGLDTFETIESMNAKDRFHMILEIIVPFIVFVGSAKQLVSKKKEYEAAEYMVKRKLREFTASYPELKNVENHEVLQSIADLIIANMTEQEKSQLIACIQSYVYVMREEEGDAVSQKKFMVITMSLIDKLASGVLERNSGLKDNLVDIALGKTTYVPFVMQNQKNI